jgi:hypothetical protein
MLNFCAGQNQAEKWIVGFREEPIPMPYDLPLLKIDATDDSNIWELTTQKPRRLWNWGRRLALLEAKKAFKRIDETTSY